MTTLSEEKALQLVEQAQRHMDQAALIFNEISDGGYEVDASFRRMDVTQLGDYRRRYVYAPQVEVTKVVARKEGLS